MNQHIKFPDLFVKILNVRPFSTQKPDQNWLGPELEDLSKENPLRNQIVEFSNKNAKIIVWANQVEFISGIIFKKLIKSKYILLSIENQISKMQIKMFSQIFCSECWGSPLYAHCKCSDDTVYNVEGFVCKNEECPVDDSGFLNREWEKTPKLIKNKHEKPKFQSACTSLCLDEIDSKLCRIISR